MNSLNFGVIVGICTDRDEDQRASIESIAAMSRPGTPLVALFNGVAPFAVNPRYEVVHLPEMLGREQGVWPWALAESVRRGWDWCHAPHDDWYWLEPGWEDFLERACATHRIGMASQVCWPHLQLNGPKGERSFTSGNGVEHGVVGEWIKPPGYLGVSMDGCALAFDVNLFARRGEITPVKALIGYGEMEAGLWCLSQGYGCARIPLNGTHHPGTTTNTRSALGIGIEGIQETAELHLERLPAHVLDEHRIQFGAQVLDCRREVLP